MEIRLVGINQLRSKLTRVVPALTAAAASRVGAAGAEREGHRRGRWRACGVGRRRRGRFGCGGGGGSGHRRLLPQSFNELYQCISPLYPARLQEAARTCLLAEPAERSSTQERALHSG